MSDHPVSGDTYGQCDVCGAMGMRLHHSFAYGTETWACDDCAGYDAEAYDDPPEPPR